MSDIIKNKNLIINVSNLLYELDQIDNIFLSTKVSKYYSEKKSTLVIDKISNSHSIELSKIELIVQLFELLKCNFISKWEIKNANGVVLENSIYFDFTPDTLGITESEGLLFYDNNVLPTLKSDNNPDEIFLSFDKISDSLYFVSFN